MIFQQPNFLGCLEPAPDLAEAANEAGALSIAHVDLMSLGVLEAPGAYGCAMAIGEGQSAGNWPSYGGPHYGFLAARERLRPPDARADRRGDRRRGRAARVRPHAPDARAAHPPREGDVEHHDESDPARAGRPRDALVARAGRPARGRGDVHGAWPGTRASAFRSSRPSRRSSFKEVAFRTPVPAREVVRRARERGVHPGYALGRDYGGWTTCCSSRSPRSGRRGHRPSRRRARGGMSVTVEAGRAWPRRAAPLRALASGTPRGPAACPRSPSPRRAGIASPCASSTASRSLGARARPPLHEPRRSDLRRRHGLLSARLLHDEAQPARARAPRRAPGVPRSPPVPGRRGSAGRARAHVAARRRCSPRSPGSPRSRSSRRPGRRASSPGSCSCAPISPIAAKSATRSSRRTRRTGRTPRA